MLKTDVLTVPKKDNQTKHMLNGSNVGLIVSSLQEHVPEKHDPLYFVCLLLLIL